MLPSLDYSNERFGRLDEPFRVNFGLLIAAELPPPRPLDMARRTDQVEAVCRHEALQPVNGWRHAEATSSGRSTASLVFAHQRKVR